MRTLHRAKGDRWPFTATLEDEDDVPINLTGRTVHFVWSHQLGQEASIFDTATIVTPAAGTVLYTPSATIDDLTGEFYEEWIVDFGLSTQVTLPSKEGRLTHWVVREVGAAA